MSTSVNSPQADTDQIKEVIAKAAATAPPETDDGSRKEEENLVSQAKALGALAPKAQLQYSYLILIRRLETQLEVIRGEREEHKNENRRLRTIELDYIKLRSMRWVSALSTACAIGGGALIIQFAQRDSFWVGAGWALLVAAGAFGLLALSTSKT